MLRLERRDASLLLGWAMLLSLSVLLTREGEAFGCSGKSPARLAPLTAVTLWGICVHSMLLANLLQAIKASRLIFASSVRGRQPIEPR